MFCSSIYGKETIHVHAYTLVQTFLCKKGNMSKREYYGQCSHLGTTNISQQHFLHFLVSTIEDKQLEYGLPSNRFKGKCQSEKEIGSRVNRARCIQQMSQVQVHEFTQIQPYNASFQLHPRVMQLRIQQSSFVFKINASPFKCQDTTGQAASFLLFSVFSEQTL